MSVSEAEATEEVAMYEEEGFAATRASQEYSPASLLRLRSERVSVAW